MSAALLRALEHAHGHLGWLAAVALAHPAILLRKPRRRALGAAIAATALVTFAAVCGACLYPAYRTTIKPALFAASPAVARLFERKEHLAIASLVLSWSGLLLHRFCGRADAEERHLSRAAFLSFAWAAVLALAAAVMGTIVAVTRTF